MCSDYQSDSDSFNPTLWEEQRQQRMTVAFDFEDKKEEEDNSGKVKVGFLFLSVVTIQALQILTGHWGSSSSLINKEVFRLCQQLT